MWGCECGCWCECGYGDVGVSVGVGGCVYVDVWEGCEYVWVWGVCAWQDTCSNVGTPTMYTARVSVCVCVFWG